MVRKETAISGFPKNNFTGAFAVRQEHVENNPTLTKTGQKGVDKRNKERIRGGSLRDTHNFKI